MLMIGLTVAGNTFATTYFIAANGSDSNNGTSKSTTWQHAPGMPNCTATCAATRPQPGDSFIFRGGDTWHFSATTSGANDVPIGGTWDWTWSGTSTNCNYPTVTTSCIYLGVDKTWFSGASFARPIMNLDNPIVANTAFPDASHPGFVTACPFPDQTFVALYLNASDVQADNFEFLGKCSAVVGTYGKDAEILRNGTLISVTNSYFHGWTEVYNPGSGIDQETIIAGGGAGAGSGNSTAATHNVIAYDVFDGSDSHCTGVNDCTGGPAAYRDAYDVHNCIFRWMSNGLNSPSNVTTVHDNLFEFMYESYDTANHGGVVEMGQTYTGAIVTFYNNVVRHTNIGITLDLFDPGNLYYFNNVSYDIGNGGNGFQLENLAPATPVTAYISNNTWDPYTIRYLDQDPTQIWNGTTYFENNHFIGYSPAAVTSLYSCNTGATCTETDNGSEVWQSESVANGQGYTPSNNYAPTSGTGATVGAGSNLTAFCTGIPDTNAAAACKMGIGGVTYDSVNHVAVPVTPATRPASGAWNAGAYQFNVSGSTNPPNPPTLLVSIPQ